MIHGRKSFVNVENSEKIGVRVENDTNFDYLPKFIRLDLLTSSNSGHFERRRKCYSLLCKTAKI